MGAAFASCMARTDDGRTRARRDDVPRRHRYARLRARAPDPDRLTSGVPGGHCELAFERLRVADEAVLGEVGEGFRYAQVRLAPGAADALHALARRGAARAGGRGRIRQRARERSATLGEHQMVQAMLADSAIDICTPRG